MKSMKKEEHTLTTDLCLSIIINPNPEHAKYAETLKKAQKWLVTTYGKRGAKKLLNESIQDFTKVAVTLIKYRSQCKECPGTLGCPVRISGTDNCKEYSPEKRMKALKWLVLQYGAQETKEMLTEALI